MANFGAANGFWRGGRSIASNGYVLIRVGRTHRLADVRGYAYEHRLVAEAKIGRPLRNGEIVHHIDGNKCNNAPSNLEVLPSAHHHRHIHGSGRTRAPGEANPIVRCACGCPAKFTKFDSSGRRRRFVPGHNTGMAKHGGING